MKTNRARAARGYLLAVAAMMLSGAGLAATLTVTTAADNSTVDGQCTLREAIVAHNAAAATADCPNSGGAWGTSDTIRFAIPGASDPGCAGLNGVCTIAVTGAPLPQILRTAYINGYSQPGSAVNTLPPAAFPNAQSGLNTQIRIEIDGTNVPANGWGLWLSGPGTNGSRISGLSVVNFAGNSMAIATTASSNNVIDGNFVGIRADGSTPGSCGRGVVIAASQGEATNSTIGGATAASRNLIAGNILHDVELNAADGNMVTGNLIGTDSTGTLARSTTALSGVYVAGTTATTNLTLISNNVVAGVSQGWGIELHSASFSTVAGNVVGLGVTSAPLGNRIGIVVRTNVGVGHGNNITGNAVSGNGTSLGQGGILVLGSAAGDPTGNLLDGNSIWDNGGPGINLLPLGEGPSVVTANDAAANLDADTGPNGLQNFPVINSAVVNGTGGVDIAFTLDSAASNTYAISAYASDSCDPSGYGEGRYFGGGTFNHTSDPNGHVVATLSYAAMPAGWAAGQYVTLLARDVAAINTSEFSQCVQITGNAPPAISITNVSAAEGNAGTTAFNFVVSLSATPTAPVSVDWYASSDTATPGPDYGGGTGTLNWAAGDGSSRTITIDVVGDTTVEPDELFTVILQNAVGASIADGIGAATIINDDAAGTAPTITSGTPPGGVVGAIYTFAVTATGSAPIAFSATGLPVGLAIDPNSGVISGTPTTWTSGPVTVTITASNGVLPDATQTFAMAILPQPVGAAGITPVPTLSQWCLLLLALLLALGSGLKGPKRMTQRHILFWTTVR